MSKTILQLLIILALGAACNKGTILPLEEEVEVERNWCEFQSQVYYLDTVFTKDLVIPPNEGFPFPSIVEGDVLFGVKQPPDCVSLFEKGFVASRYTFYLDQNGTVPDDRYVGVECAYVNSKVNGECIEWYTYVTFPPAGSHGIQSVLIEYLTEDGDILAVLYKIRY